MKRNNGVWLIAIVSFILTFLIAGSFEGRDNTMDIKAVTSIKKIESLMNEFNELKNKKDMLSKDLSRYESMLNEFEVKAAESNETAERIQKELETARLSAGLLPLEGPGVEIRLNDRKIDNVLSTNPGMIKYYIVHDSDLLNVINELRAAGAEAIAINNYRIMGNTRISCGGPTISVGREERFAPPFIIHAIGDPDGLADYFDRPNSIYNELKAWGLEFSIKKKDNISIPRYLGDVEFKYAKAIK